MLRFQGAQSFRQRLVFSTLSGRPVHIEAIRTDEEEVGLRDHEASAAAAATARERSSGTRALDALHPLDPPLSSPLALKQTGIKKAPPLAARLQAGFLRLLEKVVNGCEIRINETGTALRYRPGIITGGSGLVHECGTSRAIGYFIEPLIAIAPFAKVHPVTAAQP